MAHVVIDSALERFPGGVEIWVNRYDRDCKLIDRTYLGMFNKSDPNIDVHVDMSIETYSIQFEFAPAV